MSKEKGNIAEDKACEFLSESGYAIVERNFHSRFGEIDIIAIKDEVLHFVEVKSGVDYESAVENITRAKLLKIIKTANIYMKNSKLDNDYMYDAIIVTPTKISYLENISI